MTKENITNIISSDENPFLFEMEKRHELLYIQKENYKRITLIIEALYSFCETNKHSLKNPFCNDDYRIFIKDGYLYFESDSYQDIYTIGRVFIYIRVTKTNKKHNPFQFEFCFCPNCKANIVDLPYNCVSDKHMSDINFNSLFFEHIRNCFSALFSK